MSEELRTVGQTVAEARRAAGMTVSQVADATRVRATVVSAIENDDFRLCGGDVYARGHLKSIATAVGLDPREVVAQYDAEHGAVRAAPTTVEPIAQPTPVMDASTGGSLGALHGTLGASVGRARGTNWSAVMALALVVIVGIGLVSFLNNRGGEPAGAGVAAGPTATPSATSSTPSTSPSTPSPQPSTSQSSGDVVASADSVSVTLVVTGRASWMRVTGGANGKKTLYEGTLSKGQSKTFTDKAKVALLIGNAGAVSLTVNGRDLGAPGGNGQVVKTTFTPGDPTGAAA